MALPRFALLAVIPAVLLAQTPPTQQQGIAPAWDMRDTISQLLAQSKRYLTVIDQLKIDDWIANGAPSAYAAQQRSIRREAEALQIVASGLSRSPEKLSLALDAFFRLQYLETFTVALAEGAARYQSQQLGDALHVLVTENSAARSKLRQYLMDLSISKEQEQAVAEREAQRCMTQLSRPVPAIPSSQAPKSAPKQERP